MAEEVVNGVEELAVFGGRDGRLGRGRNDRSVIAPYGFLDDEGGAPEVGEEFGVAVELINKGLVDLKPLISATLPYRDAGKAFALAADRTQSMKVILNFD